jgi:hypothetical protein
MDAMSKMSSSLKPCPRRATLSASSTAWVCCGTFMAKSSVARAAA